jgi:glycosyltransferase involved in cell wall biosynthesis
MKVLFIGVGLVHYFNPILNRLNAGDNIQVLNLVPSSSRGHLEPGVFTTQEGVDFKVIFLKERRMTPLFKGFARLHKLLQSERPDIIVYTDYYANIFLFDLLTMWTVRRLGIKLIMKSIPFRLKKYRDALADPENLPNLNFYLPKALRERIHHRGLHKLLRQVKVYLQRMAFNRPHAHVNYTPEAVDIFGSYGVSKNRIFITYNSPDTDILLGIRRKIENEPPLMPVNEHRIIHVGRLVEWKRVDLLIHSLHLIKSTFPSAELIVVGDGPMRSDLVSLAKRLGLMDSVIFKGAIHDAEILGKLFSCSSVFVLAGMGGLAINDAMCFGKPIICSVCDGTERMLVRNAVNGLLFRNNDLKDLTSKILFLFNHPDKRREMGMASTRIIRNEINVHTVIRGYMDAFNFVMNQKQRCSADSKRKVCCETIPTSHGSIH